MIFGSNRDFKLLVGINRELLKDIVEQEILLYKISLSDTSTNIYGEALEKTYLEPVKFNCLITRGDQVYDIDEFGTDLGRTASFALLKEDLKDVQLVAQVGDIIMWHEDYYEVDNLVENQLVVGKDPSYPYSDTEDNFGSSHSIILECHYTRPERLGIKEQR